jgi:hypothetical protein
MAKPGEIVYLFEETPTNASASGPLQLDRKVVVAKRPEGRGTRGAEK